MLTRVVHDCRKMLILIPVVLLAALWIVPAKSSAIAAGIEPEADADSTAAPQFEVATIKPANPNVTGLAGFYAYPGGRIFVGEATLKSLVYYAFDVEEYQVSGGPKWASTEYYNVEALPPASSRVTDVRQPGVRATPNDQERKMLQSLLVERFGLKFRRATKEGSVYILTRGNKELQLKTAKDKDTDPRAAIFMRGGGIVDGEAAGKNVSMQNFAKDLEFYLDRPVLDQTGLKGSYDFHLPPSGPADRDMTAAAFSVVLRLGLKIKSARGPVEQIVIVSAGKPTAN